MKKQTQENSVYVRYVKCCLDKLTACIVLLFLWWLYIICAILVFIDSGRPILYKQIRVGKNGIPFQIYKFRTMVKDADKIGPAFTVLGDTRITKVGKFLRKTSLDEIPQLFNIIKGEMSFIGIRPDVVKDIEYYTEDKDKLRHGVTGFAQVNERISLTKE